MADARVTCINKVPRDDPHEGITHLGGPAWRWPREQVIRSIQEGSNTFYTLVNGVRANVEVVQGPNGPYLRTRTDSVLTNNLLDLPECPG
jgi:hypothetical protein